MISSNQNWSHMSSFDFDDLFLFSDDIIEEQTPSSFEIDQYQLQTLSNNNSTQEYQLLNLECRVCGAPAHGYNFDQITCESCKAFFRRNALRDMSQLRCRYLGSCIINNNTRRQCAYCRLKKCFDIKMRKDWIRTKEEKQLRQLIKLSKEQKKINNLTNHQQSLVNLPIIVRKKKTF